MADDFDPPTDADLDASGRDLIREFAEDRVFLPEVLIGLGLPDLDAVWSRMRARRLIGEPLPQTRTPEQVLFELKTKRVPIPLDWDGSLDLELSVAAELRRREAEIDERYRDTPIAWDGSLDTDDQIVAASIAMQREIEADGRVPFTKAEQALVDRYISHAWTNARRMIEDLRMAGTPIATRDEAATDIRRRLDLPVWTRIMWGDDYAAFVDVVEAIDEMQAEGTDFVVAFVFDGVVLEYRFDAGVWIRTRRRIE